jgi:hypothetical protein
MVASEGGGQHEGRGRCAREEGSEIAVRKGGGRRVTEDGGEMVATQERRAAK